MPHYMMDCYFKDDASPEGLRVESKSVKASGDNSAISEAKNIAKMYSPEQFRLRVVTLKGDRVIYDSRGAGA